MFCRCSCCCHVFSTHTLGACCIAVVSGDCTLICPSAVLGVARCSFWGRGSGSVVHHIRRPNAWTAQFNARFYLPHDLSLPKTEIRVDPGRNRMLSGSQVKESKKHHVWKFQLIPAMLETVGMNWNAVGDDELGGS